VNNIINTGPLVLSLNVFKKNDIEWGKGR